MIRGEILKSVSVPGLEVEAWGSGNPVFLLHGLGASRRQWLLQAPVLARNFRVYAWDARGFGASQRLGAVAHLHDFANDLKKICDEFGLTKIHLVGSSLGGRTALDFAEHFPEHIKTLTLYDTFPGHLWFVPRRLIRFLLSWRYRKLRSGEKQLKDFAASAIKMLLSPKASPEARVAVAEGLSQCDPAVFVETLDKIFADTRLAKLESITAPTLVMIGNHDRITPPFLSHYMMRHLPNAQLHVFRDCGHVANLEKTAEFNAALLEFLNQNNDLNH